MFFFQIRRPNSKLFFGSACQSALKHFNHSVVKKILEHGSAVRKINLLNAVRLIKIISSLVKSELMKNCFQTAG